MTRIFTFILLITSFFSVNSLAQEKCLTEIMFREEAEKHPEMWLEREAQEKYIREFIQNAPLQRTATGVVRIIPTVVHVIHFDGPENISKAQIENAIEILNQDMRRLNADTINTPAPFKPIGADSEIEFQLAKLDPAGNCTDGIVRVYNSMTYNARNNIKSLSYWPRANYLNVWVCNSIANTSGLPGDVIGFAQFPGTGSASTDGVVIKYDYMGAIGEADPSGAGRTVTHEVGHWLGLYHIWGDDAGLCSGTDYVTDTPNQGDWTLSICPTFPRTDNCSANSPGVMFSNYMDYTNGDCQNIFTTGQVARFNATMSSSASSRNNLPTANNLLATGITGAATGVCSPVADFIPEVKYICEGSTLQFEDLSWGGDIVSREWLFPGGTPATDTAANPQIVYSTPGTYDVTLIVTNTIGADTLTISGKVVVSPQAIVNTVPFTEGFEGAGGFPYPEWGVNNTNGVNSNTFAVTSVAAAPGGNSSLYLNNFTNNDKGFDEFITPAFNLSNVTNTVMTFDVAFAPRRVTPAPNDKLMVYYSTNCGRTWAARLTLNSAQLSTVTDSVNINFIPNANQWTTETLNLATSAVSTKPNVRFRFQFTHDTGNSLFIDNINLNGTITSVDEINANNANVKVYPNPSSTNTYVDFTLVAPGKVNIDIADVSGRVISTFSDELGAGEHQFTIPDGLDQGVYMVRFSMGDYSTTKRVVIR
jgi:PKD repeat protein